MSLPQGDHVLYHPFNVKQPPNYNHVTSYLNFSAEYLTSIRHCSHSSVDSFTDCLLPAKGEQDPGHC